MKYPMANAVINRLVDAMADQGNFEVRPEFFQDPGNYFEKPAIEKKLDDLLAKAASEGKKAAMTGQVSLEHNPYDPLMPQHDTWAAGFQEGLAIYKQGDLQ